MARPRSKKITPVQQETFDAVCVHVDAVGYPSMIKSSHL
jgi:hypothetical protein